MATVTTIITSKGESSQMCGPSAPALASFHPQVEGTGFLEGSRLLEPLKQGPDVSVLGGRLFCLVRTRYEQWPGCQWPLK